MNLFRFIVNIDSVSDWLLAILMVISGAVNISFFVYMIKQFVVSYKRTIKEVIQKVKKIKERRKKRANKYKKELTSNQTVGMDNIEANKLELGSQEMVKNKEDLQGEDERVRSEDVTSGEGDIFMSDIPTMRPKTILLK